MPNSTISALPSASNILPASDVLPMVNGGATKKVTVAALYTAMAGIPTSAAGFSSLAAWYDSQQQAGTNGSGIATLTDFAGTRNLASAGGAQPIYRATAINGKPAAEFDGATMWFSAAGNPLGGASGAGAFTMFAVYSPTLGLPAATQTILAMGGASWAANAVASLYCSSGALWQFHNGAATFPASANPSVVNTGALGAQPVVFRATYDGVNVALYLNGIPFTYQKAALNALASGGLTTIGNNTFSQFMKGAFGEGGAFTRALLGQEGLDFDRMLLRRWAISSY